jgi:two-component system, OmpR family, phosphate regulon sensor histidine kinase PhoR
MDKEKNISEQWNESFHLSLVRRLVHEMGHPVSSIRMHISNIIAGRIPPNEINKRLIAIDEMARRIEMELGNFKIFRAIELNKIESYKTDNISIRNLIYALVAGFKLKAESKGLTIQVELDENFDMKVDSTILTQILWNLVDNAIKYSYSSDNSDKKSEILIRCKPTKDFVVFEIINWGIPISNEEAESIFEMHYRGENAKKVSPSGMGIGLFVAKKCAEAINSEIIINSKDDRITATLKVRRSLT